MQWKTSAGAERRLQYSTSFTQTNTRSAAQTDAIARIASENVSGGSIRWVGGEGRGTAALDGGAAWRQGRTLLPGAEQQLPLCMCTTLVYDVAAVKKGTMAQRSQRGGGIKAAVTQRNTRPGCVKVEFAAKISMK